jgi:glucose-6-phosphate isomerase
MKYTKEQKWERFQKYNFEFPSIGLAVDVSRMSVDDAFFEKLEPQLQNAYASMSALEGGAIANPDENRMVGHYWLRKPELSPTPDIRAEIQDNLKDMLDFAAKVHSGQIGGAGGKFKNFLLIGIGGSALGPQFVANALGDPRTDKIKPFFFDNTDPDGMDRVLAALGKELNQTLCVVISKSGGTKETRNGMLVAKHAYEASGLDFGKHAVAITMKDSDLDKLAKIDKWIKQFPMWDWVGGRTSELSAVGLLPAALQGFDIKKMLDGAAATDELTRSPQTKKNPAALLSLAWFLSGNGKGTKNMVVLPYKDRLELFSKYLQQLVMESLGKALDLDGKLVNQGITVLGNKGATDQHSYIQQLRDGLNDFFAVFIEVLKEGSGKTIFVEPDITSGDYLMGFYLGTREALFDNDRESITITVSEPSAFTVGSLIALFERAVGFYASLININAYHQPGVEAGKKAASEVMQLQKLIIKALTEHKGKLLTVDEIGKLTGKTENEWTYKICLHLSANQRGIVQKRDSGQVKFGLV